MVYEEDNNDIENPWNRKSIQKRINPILTEHDDG
jgi:hypothetical protein